ncbi:serine protease [Luteolibacter sp. SL250]|uniref:S1 family peptidase n=1 Tax=Luteolibacter sp. SL250 TaxID=2995170 RepID=UPI0022702C47|nr:serine protease [Luteolibacter sp. SL250]WAC19544.1 serine protease [Luteolibacter sp. SL250]
MTVLLAALCGVSLTSCMQVGLDSVGTKVIHQRKEESVVLWKDRRIGKPGAGEYLGERTAILVGGDTRIDFEFHATSFTMRANSKAGDFSIGSAAAVAADGYYLTAAHCLNDKGLRLISYTGGGLLYTQEVRTVWSGEDMGMDLALIHIPANGLASFALTDARALQPGVEVLAGGVGGLKYGQSAGSILSVRDKGEGSGSNWKVVVHSAPLIQGDSGGPVMNGAGTLVGVTSTGGAFGLGLPGIQWVHAYRAGAIWVDPVWIRGVISADRRSQRAEGGPVFRVKPVPPGRFPRSGS